MIIKKIELFDYRGFEELSVSFNSDINVFIGENAAGKTSFLLGILKGLYHFTKHFAGIYQEDAKRKVELTKDDVKYGKDSCAILLEIKLNDLNQEKAIYNEFSHLKDGRIGVYKSKEQVSQYNVETSELRRYYNNIISEEKFIIPIIKFYPADRNSIKHSHNRYGTNVKTPQIETWANIYQDDNSFMKFFDWFFEHETLELRYQRDEKSFKKELPELKYVRKAINIALEELSGKSYTIKSDQYKNENNNSLLKTITLTSINGKKKIVDRLENKSDGEKSIISMVADIAYNLSIANGFGKNFNYLNSHGIVMIDEIGGHLHPKWQRLIIPVLRKVFPNIQLFITTHSPQIIASVESNKIFYMENFKINPIEFKTKGVDTNTLLQTVFDSHERPKEFIDLLSEFDKKIEDRESPKELVKIINKIYRIFEKDPGVNADSLLTELKIRLESYKFDLENELD